MLRSLTTPRTLTAVAAAAGIALPVAGCGSSPKQPAATGSGSKGGFVAQAYRFSACMRAHGYPNFPDPKVSTSSNGGTVIAIHAVAGLRGSPGHPKPLPKACRAILPAPQNLSPAQLAAQQQRRRADILSFAQCMRAHGITKFPDPTSQGQLNLTAIQAAGVDLQAPQTRTAGLACVPASHGLLTRAAVAAATGPGSSPGQATTSAGTG